MDKLKKVRRAQRIMKSGRTIMLLSFSYFVIFQYALPWAYVGIFDLFPELAVGCSGCWQARVGHFIYSHLGIRLFAVCLAWFFVGLLAFIEGVWRILKDSW